MISTPRTGQSILTLMLRVVCVSTFMWCLFPSLTPAEPNLSIGTLLGSASSYQAHAVTVRGTAKEIQRLPPIHGGKQCRMVYDSYVFTLEDETGSIRVEVFGVCGVSGAVTPVSDGDEVVVQGFFIVHFFGVENASLIYTNTFAVKRLAN